MKNYLFRNLLFLGVFVLSISAYAQSISGAVSDVNGPLPGANVVVKGTTNGTTTDFDGNYILNEVDSNAILVVTYLGYLTQEISVAGQSSVNILLEEDASQLEEVVVVGYGTKKKALVTGAISSVKSKDIQTQSNQRVEQILQGRVSGVTITSSSGSPGATAQIRIRGTGSNGNTGPLFIVDGMKVGGIENIAPSDIANIEVLKDAASTAIYGTEGANGIILITTKQGKRGETKISYNTQVGTQSVKTKMELMNADQFVQYMQEAGQTDIVNNGVNTNWIDETFDNAFFQRHDLSISGGSEKTTFLFSTSLLDQDGIVGRDNSSFKRYSFRSNLKTQAKDWLEVGVNAAYTNIVGRGIPQNSDTRGVIQNALIIDPLTPVTYANSSDVPQTVLDNANDFNVPLLTNNNGQVYGYPTYSDGEVLNPVAYANRIANSKNNDGKLLMSAYAKVRLMEGLTFTSRFGLERGNFFNKNETNVLYYVTSEAQNTQYGISENITRSTKWLWENFANYEKSFNEHNFGVLLGYSAEETKVPFYSLSASLPNTAVFTDPYFSNYTSFNPIGGSLFRDNLTSGFGRLSYNYAGKYLFEGSGRYDQSDKFPENNRGAFFGAASVGWIVSKEDFWSDDSKINFLKVRGSWGQNGSKANLAGNADVVDLQGVSPGYQGLPLEYEGDLGILFGAIPNKNLVWETSEQLDFGIETRSFDNRLDFNLGYYIKDTKDLAINNGLLITPPSAGGVIPEFNGGSIRNKGLEVELGWNDRTDSGFSYGINLNLSTLDNEVTEITRADGSSIQDGFIQGANAPQNQDGVTRFELGEPVWYFYGYQTAGVDSATGELIRVDQNGDGQINNEDKTKIGSPHPDLLYGGNITMGYKNFDFSLLFQGTSGNDIMATYHQPTRQRTNKPLHFFEDRWTQPGDNATFPSAESVAGDLNKLYETDLVVEDGSYMRIKQIQLGYSLPQNFLKSIFLKNLRLYVSLDDYFTFTKYKGLDPEIGNFSPNSIGLDRGYYPIPAKAVFGLSVDF
ncbi:TonB-dependent receptor [uncultured Lacinutrix sp.]|uniref:SusC/RagA family TonB-linked outer membrane protein n=1 Tax=uncultured Lacinutrix sp. TaxID=574032 RepID=UPI00263452D0|nr:TonB-dependent receptor [uncultured Lacinutrix sp.]